MVSYQHFVDQVSFSGIRSDMNGICAFFTRDSKLFILVKSFLSRSQHLALSLIKAADDTIFLFR